jgi:hypothetical protein
MLRIEQVNAAVTNVIYNAQFSQPLVSRSSVTQEGEL